MGSVENEIEVILPAAELKELVPRVSLLPPLTCRRYGPGLIIILPSGSPDYREGGTLCEDGVPPSLLNRSEEGFWVVEICETSFVKTNTKYELFDLEIWRSLD